MIAKRVFVTGGAGVIGRELVPMLLNRGCEVLVGDRQPRPLDFGNDVHYVHGDCNELSATDLAAWSPEIVFHLAASFERTAETPVFWDENFHDNVQLSHHIASLVKVTPSVRRLIFASSYLVYDQEEYLYAASPKGEDVVYLGESSPLHPRNLTGSAKLGHELELRFLTSLPGAHFSAVSARIFRGYGLGSRDVISRWIRALIQREPVHVFGEANRFDFLFARDSAEGLLELGFNEAATGVINLATGRSRSIREVVEILKSEFPQGSFNFEDVDMRYEASGGQIDVLTKLTGFQPVHSLESAILEIVAYEQTRLNP